MKRFAICFLAFSLVLFGVFANSVWAQSVVIKFGHAGMSKPNPADAFAETYKELVELWSGGDIKIEIFGKAQLGGEQQMTQALQLGTLEMQWVAINNLTPRVRSLGFFNLPYVVSSLEEAYRIHDAATKHAQNWTIKEANVRLLGWEAMGFRAFFNSKRPINHPSDMKGLVWRVPKADILVGNYEAWGVHPQPMAWHELFNALTQGVVHGGGNPIDDIVSAKLYEPCKYITQMHYNLLQHCVLIAEPFYQKLTKDQQMIIEKAGVETTKWLRWWMENLQQPRQLLTLQGKPGMKFNEPADETEFAELAKKNWSKYYKTIGRGDAKRGEQIVQEAAKIAKGQMKTFSDNLMLK